MVRFYPALTEAEFAQASHDLKGLYDGESEGSSWQSVHWTGDELQIQQTRTESSQASNLANAHLEIDELEQHDPV